MYLGRVSSCSCQDSGSVQSFSFSIDIKTTRSSALKLRIKAQKYRKTFKWTGILLRVMILASSCLGLGVLSRRCVGGSLRADS